MLGIAGPVETKAVKRPLCLPKLCRIGVLCLELPKVNARWCVCLCIFCWEAGPWPSLGKQRDCDSQETHTVMEACLVKSHILIS